MATKAKSPKLKNVPDGSRLKLSKRSLVVYRLQKKEKGKVIITSEDSERTFTKSGNTVVYLLED